MGNEFSWPCTDRKAQKQRMNESKFDRASLDDFDTRKSESNAQNMLEVEKILNQQNNYFIKPSKTNSLSTTKSSSEQARHSFQANSEDPEQNDDFLPLMITSRVIQSFESFIKDLRTTYESVMIDILKRELVKRYYRN